MQGGWRGRANAKRAGLSAMRLALAGSRNPGSVLRSLKGGGPQNQVPAKDNASKVVTYGALCAAFME